MAVRSAQAKILRHAASPLFDHAVERRTETVAVVRVDDVHPLRRGAVKGAALDAEYGFGFRTREHLVGCDIPVPDQIAGARERQHPALDIADDPLRDASGERMLHDGESDQ